MFRAKLLKAVALGLCLSVLYTGAAYAQSGGGSSPAFGGQVDAIDNALFEKQREIDAYLFKEHIKDIEEKGIQVVYTGVSDTYVEIGIANYTDDFANYLYELFGKDIVKVISTEEAQVYTTMIAPDAVTQDSPDVSVSSGVRDEQIYTTMGMPADTPLMANDAVDPEAADKADDSMVADVEAKDAAGKLENPEVIYQTTAADAAEDGKEVQLVSTTDNKADEDTSGLSVPVTILMIAGGAMVIGGAVIISGKKKVDK